MPPAPETRPSLLLRLRDPGDGEAWQLFVDLYAPLVYGLARKRGLQDADAADLTQEVFRSVADAVRRLEYDPRKGTFRGWLYTVARNRLCDLAERGRRQPHGTGDPDVQALLEAQPDRGEERDAWEHEYERQVFRWAADQVCDQFRQTTWQAFWMTAVDGRSVEEAGRELGMSAGAVHIARSRVLARLKDVIRPLLEE
jgi:RNA polymerase sigma-70 factor (ECF subfamily)